jgi:hypothetical protein
MESAMHIDLSGKFAEFRLTYTYGPGSARNFGFFMHQAAKDEPQDYEKLSYGNAVMVTPEPRPTLGPANCFGTRSTWLGALVANLLQSPCTAPGQPINYVFPNTQIPLDQQPKVPNLQQMAAPQTGAAVQDPNPSPNPGSQNPNP